MDGNVNSMQAAKYPQGILFFSVIRKMIDGQ